MTAIRMLPAQKWLVMSAGAVVVVFGLVALSSLDTPAGTRHGNFLITSKTTDAFGHLVTRHTLYRMEGSRRRRIAASVAFFLIPPNDPDRIIYYNCANKWSVGEVEDVSQQCAHRYYDGHTGSSYVIDRGVKISLSQLQDMSRWSANGTYVALGEQYEFALFDLRTGKSTNLTKTLRLEEPVYPEKWQHRSVRWGGWSPDGMHAAVIVMSPHGPGVPVAEWDEELYSLEGSTGTLTQVATHVGPLGEEPGHRVWRTEDLRWEGGGLQPPP